MTDYYRWIDPFDEIERANQRAAQAREQGQQDVLDYEHRNPGRLKRAIDEQAYRLAERVVEEQIRPTFYDAMDQKRIRDASLELLSFTPLRHVVANAESEVQARPIYDVSDFGQFGIVTKVYMKPFQYAVMDRLS